MSITSMFPAAWRVTVTVIRAGGKDNKGNPKPATEHQIRDCLIDPGTTSDPVDRSDVAAVTGWVHGPPGADVRSTDRIRIPPGFWLTGEFDVDGEPKPTPLGTSVPLRRG